tara:strand:+ start:200 stop:553 length:354 start_codon:yes stop_codon:yes gene_type:complete
MGRYYTGDIEGKFWFGIQSSRAGERFGAEEQSPTSITYYTDNKEEAQEEIKKIQKALGSKLAKIDQFFEKNNGYNDKMLEEAGISKADLEEYADLKLGEKILEAINNNGCCAFDAEF